VSLGHGLFDAGRNEIGHVAREIRFETRGHAADHVLIEGLRLGLGEPALDPRSFEMSRVGKRIEHHGRLPQTDYRRYLRKCERRPIRAAAPRTAPVATCHIR
jgi:hypothetical protein